MDAQLRDAKLIRLLEIEGHDKPDELLEAVFSDGVSTAICSNPDGDHTVEMERDQSLGWCDSCSTNTMVAAPDFAHIV